jgi:hypothetical protein
MTEPVLTTAHRSALAAMCRDVGAALVRFGRSLDATVVPAPRQLAAHEQLSPASAVTARVDAVSTPGRKLGRVQQSILGLPGLGGDAGLSAAEVASALGLAPPNAHQTLTTLAERALVERIGDDKPARWRLVARTSKPSRTPRKKVAAGVPSKTAAYSRRVRSSSVGRQGGGG